jgi:hypothetical protein
VLGVEGLREMEEGEMGEEGKGKGDDSCIYFDFDYFLFYSNTSFSTVSLCCKCCSGVVHLIKS